MTDLPTYLDVLDFWWSAGPPKWYGGGEEFDREIENRFGALHAHAVGGGCAGWSDDAASALALVIVLDQFPLNMFRGRPESFSGEVAARMVAAGALDEGFDSEMTGEERAFLYLPFMHSEDPADQERSVALYEAAELEDSLRWARHHREIVHRFGRFPHRNAILGRESTRDEMDWLASPGSFKG